MKTTRREFLQASALASATVVQGMRGTNAEAKTVSTPRGQQLADGRAGQALLSLPFISSWLILKVSCGFPCTFRIMKM